METNQTLMETPIATLVDLNLHNCSTEDVRIFSVVPLSQQPEKKAATQPATSVAAPKVVVRNDLHFSALLKSRATN